MIKPIYAVSLAIIALLILTSCGILAAGPQAEDSPATEAAPQENAVEVVETEAPVEEAAPESVVETEAEAVVETETEATAEVEAETVAEERVPEPEAVVEAAEPNMAGDAVMTGQDQAAETSATVEVAETEEDVPDETLTSTEPVADEAVESEMAEAEAMPEKQPAEQPVADTAPSPEQQALLDELTVLGQPPELTNEIWLNSEPLKLADLRGQVVIVEFWTFG